MVLKSLEIKNFRCFRDNKISFSLPDSTRTGSGLNVFVGNNGAGKTSILDAIDLLFQSRLKTKSSLKVNDFNNIKQEIEIIASMPDFNVEKVYGNSTYEANGLYFKAKTREQGASDLVSTLVFDTEFIAKDYSALKQYELRVDVSKPWGTSRGPNFEIGYFDKYRTRHIGESTYPSKFDNYKDDLNTQTLSNMISLDESNEIERKKKEELSNVNDYLKDLFYKDISDKLITEVKRDFNTFFSNSIDIYLLNYMEPFQNISFLSESKDKSCLIPLSRLGSGVEMVFSIVFLYNYHKKRNSSFALLIDEPELHLHPKLQQDLMMFFLEASKEIQIFVSTHSPYIFKNAVEENAGIYIFDSNNGNIVLDDARDLNWGHFSWSPSFGEVNYYGYGLSTIEFHNELYEELQSRSKITSVRAFDTHLIKDKGITKILKYKESPSDEYDLTLCSYVRNQIHHGTNTLNKRFTEKELAESINLLLSCF